ncbi:hypothetical protein M011DRAFT_459736 [Sporormia fimetaria CBS 119925]|uniref:Uncharacterized protein n=1 Tax=Sporormia fimetaria CBS 119925 TaxID=1340428 RepID=A0A6A6V5I7_9PLEO|nr:hypothetical protein M011DRAFT_459736 [Sporormia fimetaria CBS 119925]
MSTEPFPPWAPLPPPTDAPSTDPREPTSPLPPRRPQPSAPDDLFPASQRWAQALNLPSGDPAFSTYETQKRQQEALEIVDNLELLYWHASAREESVTATRRHFNRIALGLTSSPPPFPSSGIPGRTLFNPPTPAQLHRLPPPLYKEAYEKPASPKTSAAAGPSSSSSKKKAGKKDPH